MQHDSCSILFCVGVKQMFIFCSVLCSSAIFSARIMLEQFVLVMIGVRRIRTNSQSTMIQSLVVSIFFISEPRPCHRGIIHKYHNLWLIKQYSMVIKSLWSEMEHRLTEQNLILNISDEPGNQNFIWNTFFHNLSQHLNGKE